MMSLPDGWIQQRDPNDNPFWVDTRANPPRAIWVHPCEDERFLDEHPELRSNKPSDLDAPPSYDVATGGHALGSNAKPDSSKHSELPSWPSSHTGNKRGVLGRLKDKAIGTKEEREEHKRIKAEQAARAEERARKEREEHKRVKAEQAARAEERARQARRQQLEEREAYMRAHGGYAPYHPSYTGYPAYQNGPAPGQGLGTDNTAALLLGGLAGGLLLGDIFGGGF